MQRQVLCDLASIAAALDVLPKKFQQGTAKANTILEQTASCLLARTRRQACFRSSHARGSCCCILVEIQVCVIIGCCRHIGCYCILLLAAICCNATELSMSKPQLCFLSNMTMYDIKPVTGSMFEKSEIVPGSSCRTTLNNSILARTMFSCAGVGTANQLRE